MLKDLRHAGRGLARTPGFTIAVVLTLALAIGATTAIFAVVQRVVLNPLPYPDSDKLIDLDHGAAGLNMASGIPMSLGLYFVYLERAHTLDGVALYQAGEQTLTGEGEPERIRVGRVTPSLNSVLRVSPAIGRWFLEEEGTPVGPRVAILSHSFWLRRYGGDPSILGRSVGLNGTPMEIIGVMPASYAFPDSQVEIWIAEQGIARAAGFGFFNHSGVARLRDGATLTQARAELNGLIAGLPQVYPTYASEIGYNLNLTSTVRTLKEATIGPVARLLWTLLAAVGGVLLIACANVANLFLVRCESRQKEVAVRRALGAGRLSIAVHFLSESALLASAGGIAGLALAWGAVQLLVRFGPATLPRLEEIRIDEVSVVFALALSLLVGFAFGVMPLLQRAPLIASLHESGRNNTASRGRHHTRHLLMGVQIALALVLLVSCALMVRSFQNLRAIDPGFDPESALTFRLGLPAREYPSRAAIVAAHHAILDRLSTLPGVTAVSASTCLPLSETGVCFGNPLRVEGRDLPRNALPPAVAFRAIAGGYVRAMGFRLVRGRGIERGDVERKEPIVIVNEALVTMYFPNEDPIGKRVASSSPSPAWLTVVGVVANTPLKALAEANPAPVLFMPMSIAGGPDIPVASVAGPDISAMNYVVRSTTPPLALMPSVRAAVGRIDGNLAVAQPRSLQDLVDRASAQMAFTMTLLALASAVALLLGLVGVYGVTAYIVSQRAGEIGVRLALGAEPSTVAGMIVKQGGFVALAGVVCGLAVALAGTRLIGSLLYGVDPRDPAVFGATTLLLLAVALLACYLPARRATRVDPITALRTE